MESKDYLAYAIRTAKKLPTEGEDLNHAALGIASEAGELSITVMRAWVQLPFDINNLPEEMGDCCWYVALMANTLGVKFEDLILDPETASDMSLELTVAVTNRNPVAKTLLLNHFSGEIVGIVKGHVIYGKELDTKMLIQYLGLYLTTIALLADMHGFSFEKVVLAQNIDKLKKRYGDKYSDVAALERADKDEKKPKSNIIH